MKPKMKRSIYVLLAVICMVLPMMKCHEADAAAMEYKFGQSDTASDLRSKKRKMIVREETKKTAYVGDSIMSGLSSNQMIKDADSRVISKVGVTPYGFYKGTIMDTLLDFQPDRMYIMLGMNALVGTPSEHTMNEAIKYYKKIIKKCLKENPDMQIVVLPVSCVRPSARVHNSYIRKFNKKLKKMAAQCDVYYYDYTGCIKAADGTLKKEYNSGDGIHWNRFAYVAFKKALEEYDETLD